MVDYNQEGTHSQESIGYIHAHEDGVSDDRIVHEITPTSNACEDEDDSWQDFTHPTSHSVTK